MNEMVGALAYLGNNACAMAMPPTTKALALAKNSFGPWHHGSTRHKARKYGGLSLVKLEWGSSFVLLKNRLIEP